MTEFDTKLKNVELTEYFYVLNEKFYFSKCLLSNTTTPIGEFNVTEAKKLSSGFPVHLLGFSQETCNNRFKAECNKNFNDTIEDIKNGTFEPILDVAWVKEWKSWVSLDNRRLFCCKRAGLKFVLIGNRYRREEVGELVWKSKVQWKLSNTRMGFGIKVFGDRRWSEQELCNNSRV